MKKFIWIMVCVLLVGTAQAELVAHWKFDEGSGNSIADSSANNWTPGTVVGTAEWGSEANGGGLHIDSTTAASYVKFTGLDIGGGDAMSIAFWAKDDVVSSYATQMMFWGLDSSSAAKLKGYFPYVSGDQHLYQVQFFDSTASDNAVYSSTLAERQDRANEWHHWVFQKDAQQSLVEVYLDGDRVATRAGTRSIASLVELRFGGNSGTSNEYQGYLKDLQVHDVALTEAEVLAIIPEPATIGLISMSALFVMLARRLQI